MIGIIANFLKVFFFVWIAAWTTVLSVPWFRYIHLDAHGLTVREWPSRIEIAWTSCTSIAMGHRVLRYGARNEGIFVSGLNRKGEQASLIYIGDIYRIDLGGLLAAMERRRVAALSVPGARATIQTDLFERRERLVSRTMCVIASFIVLVAAACWSQSAYRNWTKRAAGDRDSHSDLPVWHSMSHGMDPAERNAIFYKFKQTGECSDTKDAGRPCLNAQETFLWAQGSGGELIAKLLLTRNWTGLDCRAWMLSAFYFDVQHGRFKKPDFLVGLKSG